MGRRKTGSQGIVIAEGATETAAEFLHRVNKPERDYSIRSADLKDGICNYSYEMTQGIGLGDVHNVKGTNLVKRDMKDAFSKLNVHLAFIDDAFKYREIEIEDIDRYHNHELTGNFEVTGFKIKGGEDDESIVLVGTKYIGSAGGGRMEITTPKIALDSLSSYKWYNELKDAADKAREEVALYKEGKYEIPDDEEEEVTTKRGRKKSKQLSIDTEATAVESEAHDNMEDFDSAEV